MKLVDRLVIENDKYRYMWSDLSWFTWYGFGVLSGISGGRHLKRISQNESRRLSIVEDVVTGRPFVMQNSTGHLVQFDREMKECYAWDIKDKKIRIGKPDL